MLASLTEEDADYLAKIVCRLLDIGIESRAPERDAEFFSAMSELDELLATLSHPAYSDADAVLGALFGFPDIQTIFYEDVKLLFSSSGADGSAIALSNLYSRAEHLLSFVNENGSAHFYYMIDY